MLEMCMNIFSIYTDKCVNSYGSIRMKISYSFFFRSFFNTNG